MLLRLPGDERHLAGAGCADQAVRFLTRVRCIAIGSGVAQGLSTLLLPSIRPGHELEDIAI